MPARTDSCLLSPPGRTVTGLRGCSAATSCSAVSSRLGGPTTTMRSTSSSPRKSSTARASVVRPFRRTSALLPRPRREPDPAAATIAPTEGIGSVLVGARNATPAAPRVLAHRLGEDHPAGRGLDHRRDHCRDRLVDEAPSVLDYDHGPVVEAADALSRLLALARDGHHDLL